jgi:acetolactate synthase-1/2/3 large subunit
LRTLPAIADPPWRTATETARAEHIKFIQVPEKAPQCVDLAAVVSYLSEHLPPNTVITNGAGNFTIWVHRFFRYKQPRTELAPTSGAMGYGLPAAIAAKLRHPDRMVVCFAGDGDFLMYPQELATARQYGAAVIVLVVNNGMYGTIRMHQERRFPGRVSATELESPDFVAMAQAMGTYAEKVATTGAFAGAFERAANAGRPALLELCVDRNQITPDRRLTGS